VPLPLMSMEFIDDEDPRPRLASCASFDLRFEMLKATWRAACGARMRTPTAPTSMTSRRRDQARACIAALLRSKRSFSVFGAREGAPLSLASVCAASVIRFLPYVRGRYDAQERYALGYGSSGDEPIFQRCVKMVALQKHCGNVAVLRDGRMLMTDFAKHKLYVYTKPTAGFIDCYRRYGNALSLREIGPQTWQSFTHLAEFNRARLQEYHETGRRPSLVINTYGKEPLQFAGPRQVCVSPDGFIFIAEQLNKRVQVLTPTFQFHAFISAPESASRLFGGPLGVCADRDFVVVRYRYHTVAVFRRTGEFVRCITDMDMDENVPALVSIPTTNAFACVRSRPRRVTIFTVRGTVVRDVEIPQDPHGETPVGIAVSPHGEVVAATKTGGGSHIHIWNSDGQPYMSVKDCEDVDGVVLSRAGDIVTYHLVRDRRHRGRHRSRAGRHGSYIKFFKLN
jgi:hypothetical protein